MTNNDPQSPDPQIINPKQQPIRSFVRRQGRMTAGQNRAMQTLWPVFGIPLQQSLVDWPKEFGREAPLVVEIGFGMGTSLIEQALAEPHLNFVGIEVHTPGVGSCLIDIEQSQIKNLRLINDDAIKALDWMFADNAMQRVQLYFPDPWHKKRHNKRRIVKTEFVETIHNKLTDGGLFHMATDWQPYAENMLEVMKEAKGFKNQAEDNRYVPRPDFRPVTKFEKRGQRLGHGIWDLIFEKI